MLDASKTKINFLVSQANDVKVNSWLYSLEANEVCIFERGLRSGKITRNSILFKWPARICFLQSNGLRYYNNFKMLSEQCCLFLKIQNITLKAVIFFSA